MKKEVNADDIYHWKQRHKNPKYAKFWLLIITIFFGAISYYIWEGWNVFSMIFSGVFWFFTIIFVLALLFGVSPEDLSDEEARKRIRNERKWLKIGKEIEEKNKNNFHKNMESINKKTWIRVIMVLVIIIPIYWYQINLEDQRDQRWKEIGLEKIQIEQDRLIKGFVQKIEKDPVCKEIYTDIKICKPIQKNTESSLWIGSLYYTGDDFSKSSRDVYFKIKNNNDYTIQRGTNITGFQLYDKKKKIRIYVNFYYSESGKSSRTYNQEMYISADDSIGDFDHKIWQQDYYKSKSWDKEIYSDVRIEMWDKNSIENSEENIKNIFALIDGIEFKDRGMWNDYINKK